MERITSSILLLLLLIHCWSCMISSAKNDTTDLLALQSFRALVSVPNGTLSSWSEPTLHFCSWHGVTCGGRRHPERVVGLDLSSLGLAGRISPHIANLTFLARVDLSNNSLSGPIPPHLVGLHRLRDLDLSYNFLEGPIPKNLSRYSALRNLYLEKNRLSGPIPIELGSLSSLEILALGFNPLSGSIPDSLGNISKLRSLFLYGNGLDGRIPGSLGGLSRLRYFQVSNNELSGEVPTCLYNISSIEYFLAGGNRLVGALPSHMFRTLPNLRVLQLFDNQLDGFIPNSLPNASRLWEIALNVNKFVGTVPSNLGNLKHLDWMNLAWNRLEATDAEDWSFITALTNCSHLGLLALDQNSFGGELPSSVANLSARLDKLSMSGNRISGSIPEGIGRLTNLSVFFMDHNQLTGMIPATIGRLRKLHIWSLWKNKLSGSIPSSISNLTQLNGLFLMENGLNGSIPVGLESCKSLEAMDLSYNELSGSIPKGLLTISSLSIYLNLSNNALVGPLPVEVGSMRNLAGFDVSENKLSGEIPSTIASCQSLEQLFMEGNFFQGSIPPSFGNLKALQELDLSRNNFSGPIPEALGNLRLLTYLNLSFNDLEGEVPQEGAFENASAVSVLGNNKLCGGNLQLQLPICPTKIIHKKHMGTALKITIPVVSVILLLCLVVAFFVFISPRWVKKPSSTPSFTYGFKKISYGELYKATNGFSTSNLIGSGSFGSVYKAVMDSSANIFAVKVLNLNQQGALSSFKAECRVLRNIRHRNLVKIITSCSSIDFKGDEFKALVLEFMPNKTLDQWLHPNVSNHSEVEALTLVQRLNIAIDVASGLHYLHHEGREPIIHSDLKPSNVLLDDEMCAHVGDFGLAKILSNETSKSYEHPSSSILIKGSIGYIAPEYGMGVRVSSYGDVYSYGILLLEMFTGKRPFDEMFEDGHGLRSFVESSFPDRVLDVVDPRLHLCNVGLEGRCNFSKEEHECLVSVLKIGILCSKDAPRERMNMIEVTKEMAVIRKALHNC